MKERNLLVFIAALIASILLVISVVVRLFVWYDINNYGSYVSVPMVYYIIPIALLWLGWYLDDVKSVLVASAVMTVNLYFHLSHIGILSGEPLVVSSYAPAIKTSYVLNLVLIVAVIAFGFVSYYIPKFKKD